VVIFAGSAKRAVELSKAVTRVAKAGKVGKLFGKHKDVAHQTYFLKNTKFAYAVGTPGRVNQLLDTGVLSLEAIHAIILDSTWRNPLGRTLLENPESKQDLTVLFQQHLFKHCKASKSPLLSFF
jgi:hypothetical protein